MGGKKSAAGLLALVVACLLAVTACSVPGGYTVASLRKLPESGLTYPGSTEAQALHSDGNRGNVFGKGSAAMVGVVGTTTASPAEVIAYYSAAPVPTGWAQVLENPRATDYPGRVSHIVASSKGTLSFTVDIWTEGTATKYDTDLESTAA